MKLDSFMVLYISKNYSVAVLISNEVIYPKMKNKESSLLKLIKDTSS